MSDRELLELAAKAAGIVLEYEEETDRYFYRRNPYYLIRNGQSLKVYWNPLTDDADAFQLMVKLGLLYECMLFHYISLERFKTKDVDDATAIRRGIVRAAAEDGRNMQ